MVVMRALAMDHGFRTDLVGGHGITQLLDMVDLVVVLVEKMNLVMLEEDSLVLMVKMILV